MKYLVKKTRKGKTHIWKGDDTYCRMYSTNGLCHEKYEFSNDVTERGICHMCENNKVKSQIAEIDAWLVSL